MTEPAPLPDRAFLTGDAAAGLSRLAPAGRIMAVVAGPGVLLERIGTLEAVTEADGWLCFHGPAHTARLRRAALAAVVVDFTPRMRDRPMPRIELQGADGVPLMTLHGLDGASALGAALGPLLGNAAPPRATPQAAQDAPGHPAGARMLKLLHESGARLRVGLATEHVTQDFHGVLPASLEMQGYQNLIQSDFHLHLADSAVAAWRREMSGDASRLVAEAASGIAPGLTIDLPPGFELPREEFQGLVAAL